MNGDPFEFGTLAARLIEPAAREEAKEGERGRKFGHLVASLQRLTGLVLKAYPEGSEGHTQARCAVLRVRFMLEWFLLELGLLRIPT